VKDEQFWLETSADSRTSLTSGSWKCEPIHPLPHMTLWHSAWLVEHKDITFLIFIIQYSTHLTTHPNDQILTL
jgi:hypothetical protein